MSNSSSLSSSLTNTRLLSPEVLWLEPEQMEQAKTMSDRVTVRDRPLAEAQQWQRYLNALALLSFQQWLSERLPESTFAQLDNPLESVSYIEMNGFKFCLLTVEHVLDETVQIPQAVVEQPALAAHFYVVHEVSEEQALVTVRGFLRFDEWMHYRAHNHHPIQDGYYQLPLAILDVEPNHLLFYCRYLQPAAIFLPIDTAAPVANPVLVALPNTTTKLTQWLQNTFNEPWQTIDQFMNADTYLAWSTRSMESGAKRGKLINLGVQLGQQAIALLVNVTSEAEGKLGVLVQLHPTGNTRYLIANLKLSLRSHMGQTLQEVTARSQDNYIQLKPFKGKPGTRFSVAIHLGNETVEENFEL